MAIHNILQHNREITKEQLQEAAKWIGLDTSWKINNALKQYRETVNQHIHETNRLITKGVDLKRTLEQQNGEQGQVYIDIDQSINLLGLVLIEKNILLDEINRLIEDELGPNIRTIYQAKELLRRL